MKIVHHHANGRFDWLISEHQSVNPSREAISILSGKYKRFMFCPSCDDSSNTCYLNAIRCKEKENAFIKNRECGLFSLVFVINLGGVMTEIFSVGLQTKDKGMKA